MEQARNREQLLRDSRAVAAALWSENVRAAKELWSPKLSELNWFADFYQLCSDGKTEAAAWLFSVTTICVYDKDVLLIKACCKGHLDTAQWLLTVYPAIDVRARGDSAFKEACFLGHLHVAEWLLTRAPDIKYTSHQVLFEWLVKHEKWSMLEWLFSHVSADTINPRSAFSKGCKYALDVPSLRWLLDVFPAIDIHTKNDKYFYQACNTRRLDVATLLIDRGVVPRKGHFMRPKYFLRLFRSIVMLAIGARRALNAFVM